MKKNYLLKDDSLRLKREHFQIDETIVNITSEKNECINIAKKEILKQREILEKFIEKQESFKYTFEPFTVSKNLPDIIKKMVDASQKFNLGPMSTVAGTIAEYAVKAMKKAGAKHAVVDNGGDIAIYSKKPVYVGVYTGRRKLDKLALQIKPTEGVQGVCTSSGWIGHSYSSGNTDAAVVLSDNVSLSDAAATALGNKIKQKDDIEISFGIFDDKPGVKSALVFLENHVGLWGDIPQIVKANVPYDVISKDEMEVKTWGR